MTKKQLLGPKAVIDLVIFLLQVMILLKYNKRKCTHSFSHFFYTMYNSNVGLKGKNIQNVVKQLIQKNFLDNFLKDIAYKQAGFPGIQKDAVGKMVSEYREGHAILTPPKEVTS